MSIFVVVGHPGDGKSYWCTREAVLAMQRGRPTYTNYPVRDPLTGNSSFIWEPEYASNLIPIQHADIIIDEGYRDYSCKNSKEFSVEEHTFFGTCRHNDLDILVCVQNPARVEIVIRELAASIIELRAFHLPIISWLQKHPLGFRVYYYDDIKAFQGTRESGKKKAGYYAHKFIWFKQRFAQAYDTHYYKNQSHRKHEPKSWYSEEKELVAEVLKCRAHWTPITNRCKFLRSILMNINCSHFRAAFVTIRSRLIWSKIFHIISIPFINIKTWWYSLPEDEGEIQWLEDHIPGLTKIFNWLDKIFPVKN